VKMKFLCASLDELLSARAADDQAGWKVLSR
jgi:hypothetical protein